jgi:hypothetical protein
VTMQKAGRRVAGAQPEGVLRKPKSPEEVVVDWPREAERQAAFAGLDIAAAGDGPHSAVWATRPAQSQAGKMNGSGGGVESVGEG